jgi:DNA-binding NarL/FixJ family response regulator
MPELLIADDHPLFREALRNLVARAFPQTAIHEADSLHQLYELVEAHADADLLLLDLDMPGAQGFSALLHVQSLQPQLPVVIVSAHEDPVLMQQALGLGAMGFIPKSVDGRTLDTALHQVLEGNPWLPPLVDEAPGSGTDSDAITAQSIIRDLTPQQLRVLQMLGAGQLNKQIAYDLGISEATVKAHMTAIMRKLGVTNRTQAVLMAGSLGLGMGSWAGKRGNS